MNGANTASSGATIVSRFLENVNQNKDVVALRMRRADATYSQLTYAQYADQVARCAAGLRALGFGPGQHLVLMLRNRPEFHVLDLAAVFCGGVPVSIYNSSAPEQIQYLVNHCEATIAIADDPAFLQRFAAIRDQLPTLKHLGVLGSDVPPGAFSFDALLDHAPLDLLAASHAVKPGNLATLIYTSGTTGPPKAVMISHANVVCAADGVRQATEGHPQLPDGLSGIRVVSYLPMAHVAERNSSHYFGAMFGYEVTCCPDAAQIGVYLREVRPQFVFGVPRVWEKLYGGVQAAVGADPERAKKLREAIDAALPIVEKINAGTASDEERKLYQFLDEVAFKNLRTLLGLDASVLALTGAAPMPRELQLWFRAIGVPISDVYGMSENCGAMTWSPLAVKPGTVGKALPGVEVKLAEDGEICCRGGVVFSGYYKDPDKTADALDADGWLHSGDIGQIDEHGYLRIVDRKKELIITAGGKNISPANLEQALKNIPLVGQACAIGDDRPFVSALLVLDPDVAKTWASNRGLHNATLKDLANNPELIAEVENDLERVMAGFNRAEKVKRVKILDTDWLPDSDVLTPTAKLKRREIHKKYRDDIEAFYATTLAPPAGVDEDTQPIIRRNALR